MELFLSLPSAKILGKILIQYQQPQLHVGAEMPQVDNQLINPDSHGVREDLSNSLFDEDDPNSVINKLPPTNFRKAVLKLKETDGHRFFDTDRLLYKWAQPNEWDARIRLSFWDEFYFAQRNGKMMNVERMCRGVVDKSYIHKMMLDPRKLVYVLTHPESYTGALRMVHKKGLERMKEIMALPMVDDKGKPIPSVINAILKCTEMADVRLKGAVPQRMQIDSRTMNVNVDVDNPLDLTKMSIEQLEQLERKMVKRAKELSAPREEVIEAEAIDESN